MLIAGYAIGAHEGYVYVRAEYPKAIERLKIAIRQAEEKGFVGNDILGADFNFSIKIKEGAGAFVCGEETALMKSIEGKRGMPRTRPPFPAVKGLWDCPTSINNVETFANVPWIVTNGAAAFNHYGTERSKGTKVFALAGKINRGGLVEVPMGVTIRDIVYTICSGIKDNRRFKAVQIGGPAGGCVPTQLQDTIIDYDSISRTGAIIGGGPAGLSATYFLAQKGYQITILEAMPQVGGMLRYGIPDYRLPPDILDLEINTILELGIDLRTNTCLGEDFTIRSLKNDGYDAIFLGLGAWKSSRLGVPGEEIEGVLSGIDFLRDLGLRKRVRLRGKVAVVGGGNTAIDCARAALRLGADEVRIYYRRTRHEMPAHAMEIHEAEIEGAKLELLVAPTQVLSRNGRVSGMECIRMDLGEPDSSGRRRPIPKRGSEFKADCDFIFTAIGQSTTTDALFEGRIPDFLPPGEIIELTRWKTIRVGEQTGETDVEGVFAGGDVVTGAATVIEAVAAGRKAAFAIDNYFMKGKALPEPTKFNSRKDDYDQVTQADLRTTKSSAASLLG